MARINLLRNLLFLLCISQLIDFNHSFNLKRPTFKEELQFDFKEAKRIYFISQLPYGSEAKIKNMTCGLTCDNLPGMKILEVFKKYTIDNDVNAYVISISEEKKEIYFSFKGTSRTLQLIHELIHSSYQPYKTEFFNLENAKAMQYFQEVYLDFLHEDVVKNLIKYAPLQDEGYKFIFSGYSLGGALASLAILDAISSNLIKIKEDSPKLVTHGSPRVVNAVLSDYLNEKIPSLLRIVNYNDIVPHIPPCNLELTNCKKEEGSYASFFAGWHLRKEIWINSNGNYDETDFKECDNNNAEDPTCSNSFTLLSPGTHSFYYGLVHDEIIDLE